MAVTTLVTAMALSACVDPSGGAPPRVVFASRTAWPTPPAPLAVLDTAAAITVFQQQDDAVKAALRCWRRHMTPTAETLAEATRFAGRLATAYRGFADVLRAYQWPAEARLHAGALAREYDTEFVQYDTLAAATSVGRYRAVMYWMGSTSGQERADLRQALGLFPESTGLVVIDPTSSPATGMTAC